MARMLERLTRMIESLNQRFAEFFAPFVGAAGLFALVRLGMDKATEIHWILGAAVCAAAILLALFILRYLRRLLRVPANMRPKSVFHNTFSDILSQFLVIVFLAIAAFSWISYTLHVAGAARYDLTREISSGVFVDYYAWLFIDMIPLVETWETLQVASPAEPTDMVAGLPVLAFRVLILIGVFSTFKLWLDTRKS